MLDSLNFLNIIHYVDVRRHSLFLFKQIFYPSIFLIITLIKMGLYKIVKLLNEFEMELILSEEKEKCLV